MLSSPVKIKVNLALPIVSISLLAIMSSIRFFLSNLMIPASLVLWSYLPAIITSRKYPFLVRFRLSSNLKVFFNMSQNIKKRNWAFVLYPESAPDDWRDILSLSGVQGCISPLHNQDIDPTGTVKKPHYHIILVYGAPTTFNNVKSLCDKLNQPIPQPLEQVIGYYRYLTHKDNPDKYQYNECDIECFNGFNIRDFVEISKSEVNRIKLELLDLSRKMEFDEYSDFINYVMDNLDSNYFDVASNHTIFFAAYFKSAKFSRFNRRI